MNVAERPIEGYWVEDAGNGWIRLSGGIPWSLDEERYILYPGPLAYMRGGCLELTPLGRQQIRLGRADCREMLETLDQGVA